jgi:hypothetical protein
MTQDDYERVAGAVLDTIQVYTDEKLKNAPFVCNEIGVTQGAGTHKGNKVDVKGIIYDDVLAIGNTIFPQGSVVFIFIPNSQYSNMFILGQLDDTPIDIKGGSINLGNGNFTVNNNGVVSIKNGSINLGNNKFTVDNNGNATASSLHITGGDLNIGAPNALQKIYSTSYTSNGITFNSGISPQGGFEARATKSGKYVSANINGMGGGLTLYTNQNPSNPLFELKFDEGILDGYPEVGYLRSRCEEQHEKDCYYFGTVYNSGGGVVFVSDENLKHDIKPLDTKKTSNFIYSLSPTKFKLNNGTSDRFHHGLIAQEVKEKMGDDDWGLYVDRGGEDGKGLRYEELIADLVCVVQEQNKRIKSLEDKIEADNK